MKTTKLRKEKSLPKTLPSFFINRPVAAVSHTYSDLQYIWANINTSRTGRVKPSWPWDKDVLRSQEWISIHHLNMNESKVNVTGIDKHRQNQCIISIIGFKCNSTFVKSYNHEVVADGNERWKVKLSTSAIFKYYISSNFEVLLLQRGNISFATEVFWSLEQVVVMVRFQMSHGC